MDYRFGYERTPESALKFRIGQWVMGKNNKLVKRIFAKGYDTREAAWEIASKYNEELVKGCPWNHYEIAK